MMSTYKLQTTHYKLPMRLPLADIIYSVRILLSAKVRTLLTTLGIVIGVMSVTAIASVGRSAQDLVLTQVSAVGANRISVFPGASAENEPPPMVMGLQTATLTERDYRAARALPHVVVGSPLVTAVSVVTVGPKSSVLTIFGVGEEWPELQDSKVGSGRFFSRSDSESYGRVAVLGSKVAADFFGDGNPLGATIRIKDSNYQVIGVMAERGSSIGQGGDKKGYLPVTTVQKMILGISHVTAFSVKADAPEHVWRVMEDIRFTLRRRHHITDPTKEDFSPKSADQVIGVLGQVTTVINIFLIFVTAISLVVGGINIMNIMYVAVRERTREIGLRKAVGARPRRILMQFLVESSLIALLG